MYIFFHCLQVFIMFIAQSFRRCEDGIRTVCRATVRSQLAGKNSKRTVWASSLSIFMMLKVWQAAVIWFRITYSSAIVHLLVQSVFPIPCACT